MVPAGIASSVDVVQDENPYTIAVAGRATAPPPARSPGLRLAFGASVGSIDAGRDQKHPAVITSCRVHPLPRRTPATADSSDRPACGSNRRDTAHKDDSAWVFARSGTQWSAATWMGAVGATLGDAVTPAVAAAWDEVYWLCAARLIGRKAV